MRTRPLLRWAATAAAAVLSFTVLGGAQPALAAPKPRLPLVVTAQPAPTSGDSAATFAWTTVTDATYTCSLDGGTATSCTSPKTYTGLTNGPHTVVLRGKLNASYRPNTKTIAWVVDVTPPGAPTVTPVPSPTSSTSADISFVNGDPSAVSHTCSLDGGPEETCTSPYAVAGPLAEGSHTVAVRAVDSTGNTSAPVTVTWLVDVTAPTNVHVTGPTSPTNATSASVTFSATGATAYTCSVDDATATSCTSPLSLSGLADGTHSVTVNASDGAGNAAQPGTALWEVDTTAPVTPSILTGPASITNQTSATFVVGDVDDSGVLQCRLDDPTGPWVSCPPALTWTGLAAGLHSLEVRSHDAAGNSSGVVSATWEVDTIAPAPATFTGGPGSPSRETSPTFSFEATDGSANGFQCSLDGDASAACDTGEWQGSGLSDGSHTLSVVSKDLAGNDSTPVTWTWTIDTVAPVAPEFSTTPSASTTDTTALFSFASEPGTSFTCSVDGATAVYCASPLTLKDLALGGHSLTVTALDAAGNTSSSSYTWTVTEPVVPGPGTGGGGGGGGGTPTTPTTPSTPTTPTAPAAGPSVSIAASTALRGTSTVTFGADVSGVSTSSVFLADVTGPVVATTLACTNAGGAVVPCTAGSVRTVTVTPNAALLPGASYTLQVTAAVVGTGGSAVKPTSATFRASTTEQENSLRAGYTWARGTARAAYGRSYLSETHRGATFTTTFSGTAVTWFTRTAPTGGKATVLVDGVRKATVDTYSAGTRWKVAKTVKGLRAGTHTLQVVVSGRKAKASRGTQVVVDAVKVGKKVRVSPVGTAKWQRAASTKASGKAYAVASAKGATASFTFRGTGVTWSTSVAPTMGKAAVYVDGVRKATVDNYAAKAKWNVLRSITGLSNGTHTVKVVVLGSKRKASRGTTVVVDRWSVR